METIEAIYHRQSVGKMMSEPVPRSTIERLLAAAVQAPNHYAVRPWRFVVMTGEARHRLGEVLAQVLRGRFPEVDQGALDKERGKPLRAPVVIAVGVDRPSDSRVLEIENVCAAAAACENLLLAAEDLGVGGHWRTGDAARDPDVKKFLGLAADQHLIAFLYLGYPEASPEPRQRPGIEDRTTWME
jgi:nitroreductase